MAKLDLTGQRFGRLLVIEEAEQTGYTRRWNCKCDCGNEKVIAMPQLRSGKTTSCGCYNRERTSAANLIDLTGQRFGKLTVTGRAPDKHKSNKALWICQCDCGSDPIKAATTYLTTGDTSSCGCHRIEQGSVLQAYNEEHRVEGVFTPILKSKIRADNSSGVKGVSFNNRTGKYRAYISLKGKRIFLGEHPTIEAAAAARRDGEEKYHKPYLEAEHDN